MMSQAMFLGGDGVGDSVAKLCGDHHIVRGGDVLQQHPIVVILLNKVPNVSTCNTTNQVSSSHINYIVILKS